ncbi:MAG: excinuclease ABC subunit UvrA [Deltaproteobacteria bacterium]|nr:MAG: excinuclease ABC subunit UvrA [Deltaproteobacteria bacterium]
MSRSIVVKGARVHNLQDIDVAIPRDRLVVITGLSGSGKSSLAFDTIYAEGQRRYVESLSAYARQFLDQMEKPDVDSIEGLSPSVSIEQKTTSRSPRSTVGTTTEIYDYLRLLYATVGRPHCFECGREIASQSVSQIVERILELPRRSRVQLLAPIVRDRKGEYRRELADLRKRGFVRARIDGELVDLDSDIRLARTARHTIEVVVDRIVLRPGVERRLTDSVEMALRLGSDVVTVLASPPSGGRERERSYSRRFACPDCDVSYPEISPRLFSFNSPHGACPECNGVGTTTCFDLERVVVAPEASIAGGAIGPWGKRLAEKYARSVATLCRAHGVDPKTPFGEMPEALRRRLLEGPEAPGERGFAGILPILMRRYRESESDWVRGELEKYMTETVCPSCEGQRLRREARHVLFGGKSITEVAAMPVDRVAKELSKVRLTRRESEIARVVLREILERLEFMSNVGLGYLSLDRPTGTLSGGESQRVRLATQIGVGLSGVLYVLDEPSIGLHPRDNARLLESLRRLTKSGNTVLVVEHDADTIRSADHVIDMGPGAGRHGGRVVSQGSADEVIADAASPTGRFLSGADSIPVPRKRRRGRPEKLVVRGARLNNLKNVTAEFPLGKMTCVTGVSGSGKSSLVVDTLYAALAARLHGAGGPVGPHDAIEGIEEIDKVIDIDQTPIGRTPRSNPATYTGLFTDIRDLFAMLPEARMRGYEAGRFSFNVRGGRCEACAGDGLVRVEMQFLPDVYVPCDVCGGRRYNRETLEVTYKGLSIADVLDLTVAEALELLENIPSARRKLETLASVGLEYIHLGQPATTLSGGEAQRIKLAKELARRATGRTLYILDEPTTGLHFADVKKLLEVLGRLVDVGNTVVIIEHHVDVIKSADYVIDLGPEGGDAGGEIVVAGTPEDVAACPASHTGRFLASALPGEAA